MSDLVERLRKRAKEDQQCAENNKAVVEALAEQMRLFEAREGHNVYAVRMAVDHKSGMERDTRYASDLTEAATEIEALRRENQELRTERDSARNDEWLAAISAVQYMEANWYQDCRSDVERKALEAVAEDFVSALKQAGPTEYLDMKWKGAQEAVAAEAALQELKAVVKHGEAKGTGQ